MMRCIKNGLILTSSPKDIRAIEVDIVILVLLISQPIEFLHIRNNLLDYTN